MVKRRILLAIGICAGFSHAAGNCEITFQACPGSFESAVLTVPRDVIWVNPVFPACQEKIQVAVGGPSSPPSIVFIIDNSGSMSEDKDKPGEGNDPGEARFNVVKTLLDTMRVASPSAEVGLVIFTRRLAFDHRDNPFFKPAFPADTSQHDSFVPLTPLNKVFPGGATGLDTLKALIRYHGKGNLDYQTARPGSRPNAKYGPTSMRDGTDITLGFQAAKEAMKDAHAAKGDQYFIFLSDGAPSSVDSGREDMDEDFIKGENTPATFTVFFKAGDDDPKAPPNIVKMTENIRNNGYSPSNPKSDKWALNLPGSQLLALLQSNVLNTILTNANSKPKSATLEIGGKPMADATLNAGKFTFPKRIPLAPDQTSLSFAYTYAYEDSGRAKEKTVPYTVTVKRGGDQAPVPDSLARTCRDQAVLSLYHDGRPLERVTADQSELQARLALPAGESCPACPLQVTPSQGADRENLILAPVSGVLAAGFTREVSPAAAPGNGRLEHAAGDSIVLLYRNPENPLDTARRSFPYTDVRTGLAVEYHNTYSRGQPSATPSGPGNWILAGPGSAAAESPDPARCCTILEGGVAREDSLKYVGLKVEATRAFRVEVRVFSTLGEFVDEAVLTMPQEGFAKLDKGDMEGSRKLRVLWKNRSRDGSLVGTGAYVLKTTVTLLRVPGVAEDEVVRSDTRVIGVIRGD